MASKQNQRGTESDCGTTGTRFRIEKLEERIAPAKGGIPGKPAYHYPPGQHCYYGICCKHGCHD